MNHARCTQTNSLYSAEQFAQLPEQQLAHLRQNLQCPGCSNPAFYRKQAHDGRDPCFGARPHADWCHLGAVQAAKDSVNANATLINPNKRLVVDFGYGSPVASESAELRRRETCDLGAHDESAARAGVGGNVVQHMRLRPLLHLLTTTAQLQNSGQLVEVAGFGVFRAADFFVAMPNLAPMHGGRVMGVFGQISSAGLKYEDESLWLNSGSSADPSICVPTHLVESLLSRFNRQCASAFAGAFMLVVGLVRTSQSGKHYIVLGSIEQIAVDLLGFSPLSRACG